MLLVFSKNVYTASLTSYFTFYLIERFHLSVQDAQVQLFVFMAAIAVGTLIGGPISDRIGRRPMIWISILGALPFTLALPYANLFWTGVLTIIIGLLMASAFPAILVYAHELMPGRVGLVSGMFFGFAFGLGGLGAAAMGRIADATASPSSTSSAPTCRRSAWSSGCCRTWSRSARSVLRERSEALPDSSWPPRRPQSSAHIFMPFVSTSVSLAGLLPG